MPLTEEQFKENEKMLLDLVLRGRIAVHRPDGVKITSTPDGRLIQLRPDGAMKIEQTAQPVQEPAGEPEAVPEPEPEVDEEPLEVRYDEPDDLTAIPGIGPGRLRKLEAGGFSSYHSLVEAGAEELSKVLNVLPEVAADIIAAAKEMME
jgi:predicted flap endonuclease-1-like 5' DNA nuclease